MTAEPRWISKKALLLLHEMSLAEFGGERGIRDEGLLDSALARPLNLYAYKSEMSVTALAAAYAYGIVRNHPFIDGNKRAAFLAIGLFLGLNGYRLAADQMSAVQTIFDLAAGSVDEEGLSAWIEANMEPRLL